MNARRPRVLVALSGGVDSSVAAALLKEQGFDLVGVTLHLWDAEGPSKIARCCAPEDRDDARRTSEHLGIPYYVMDAREAFLNEVVTPFVADAAGGRTPSPCVHCNRTVKLTALCKLARTLGASFLATGHYVRLAMQPDGLALLRGRDRSKDQSYFLFGLPRELFSMLMFPLGDFTKDEVRAHARRLGLPNADKPDSQELCFVSDGRVADFVARRGAAVKTGSIVDAEGRALGTHPGVAGFTVGQRRGLGLSGGARRYVLRVVGPTGAVVVGDEAALFETRLRTRSDHWLGARPREPFDAWLRIRYRHEAARARITPREDGFEAEFVEPQRAITPGQAAVVYDQERVLGGGFIVDHA